ncbi:hypothetical protein V8F33_006926, partial [Rhypophila sp. PSN 637]
TPLHAAASNRHVEVVKLLLEKGANITNVSTCTKRIVLAQHPLIAPRNGRTEVIRLLLGTGRIDFYSRDCFERIPLWWARNVGSVDVV